MGARAAAGGRGQSAPGGGVSESRTRVAEASGRPRPSPAAAAHPPPHPALPCPALRPYPSAPPAAHSPSLLLLLLLLLVPVLILIIFRPRPSSALALSLATRAVRVLLSPPAAPPPPPQAVPYTLALISRHTPPAAPRPRPPPQSCAVRRGGAGFCLSRPSTISPAPIVRRSPSSSPELRRSLVSMSTALAASHPTGHSPLPPQRPPAAAAVAAPTPLTPSRRTMSTASAHRQNSNGASSSPSDDHRAQLSQPPSHGKHSPLSAQQLRAKAPTSNPVATPQIPTIKKERHSPSESQQTPTTERHRPRRLDLSGSTKSVPGARPSAPLTSQQSAGLSAMQDVGLACLSPGFQTQDPTMQQQLQRSMDLREQQRQIIEARQRTKDTVAGPDPGASAFGRAPTTGKRKGPPPGLSIHAPSAHAFANEPRAIQSAPLHQSFTGLNKPGGSHVHPLSRQILDSHADHRPPPPSALHNSHQPSQYTNRLPPISAISDVFANDRPGPLGASHPRPASTINRQDSNGYHGPPLPSPGFPPQPQHQQPPTSAGLHPPPSAGLLNGHPPRSQPPSRNEPKSSIPPITSARSREFKSAEDAVQALSGGREELLPRIVHYGGHQPPTPPSPLPPGNHGNPHHPAVAGSAAAAAPRSGSGRRRTRDEYERDYVESGERMDIDSGRGDKRAYAPWDERDAAAARQHDAAANSRGPGAAHSTDRSSWERGRARDSRDGVAAQGPFGYGRDSPETQRRKKEEFMALCARAWDLFHS